MPSQPQRVVYKSLRLVVRCVLEKEIPVEVFSVPLDRRRDVAERAESPDKVSDTREVKTEMKHDVGRSQNQGRRRSNRSALGAPPEMLRRNAYRRCWWDDMVMHFDSG